MTHLDRLLQRAREASEPSPDAVARVKARLADAVDAAAEADVPDPSPAERLLRGVGAPTPEALGRVQGRLQRELRRRLWRRRVVIGAAVLAMAAGLLLVPRGGPAPAPVPATDRPITLALTEPATGNARPTDDVGLTWTGAGELTGTERAPHIRWDHGRLEVEVRPQAGVGLVVDTRDARVSVVGTGFSVDRTVLGTVVAVDHGVVAVDCASGESRRVTAGEQVLCLPHDVGGLLGRARALHDAHASPADELHTVDRALALAVPAAIRGELLARRIRLLLDLGRTADASVTAHRYLDEGHLPRKTEIRQALGLIGSPPPERSTP